MSGEVRFNPATGQFEVKRDDWVPLVDPQQYADALRVSQERAERIVQLEAQLAQTQDELDELKAEIEDAASDRAFEQF